MAADTRRKCDSKQPLAKLFLKLPKDSNAVKDKNDCAVSHFFKI